MNEAETISWNLSAEGWQRRLKAEMSRAERRTPNENPHYEDGVLLSELLGDAILDDVVS